MVRTPTAKPGPGLMRRRRATTAMTVAPVSSPSITIAPPPTMQNSAPAIELTVRQVQMRGGMGRLLCLSATSIRVSISLTVFQHADHRFTDDNNADTGLLSNDLHDILHDFTQVEEMLCSLASPCFLMWVSKGGLYKARRFYRDIAIRPPDSVDLPDDAIVLHRLPAVEPREETSAQPASHSPQHDPNADGLQPDYHELIHEQNSFVHADLNGRSDPATPVAP